MKMTKEEYKQYCAKKAKPSPIGKNCLLAFLIGGAICALGQGLGDLWGLVGLAENDAKLCATLTLVFLASFTTGLGLYDQLAKIGGAGTLVPITGFSNAIVSPALEFKSEGYVLGLGAKMFTIAGPVLVYGISASIIYGFIKALLGV